MNLVEITLEEELEEDGDVFVDLAVEEDHSFVASSGVILHNCWPNPVISHVTLEEMENLYEDRPDLFAPGQTVFDKYQMEIEDVVKEYQTLYGTKVENLPVEREGEVKEALGIIRDTPYQEYQPTQLRFVKDVGAEQEFRDEVKPPEPVLGQVTAWTSPNNEMLLSQFVTDTGNTVSTAIIREWAGKVYDSDDMLQVTAQYLYDRDEVTPPEISSETIQTLLKTFEPHTMMRSQLVDGEYTVALEKRLRDAPEEKLRSTLTKLEISPRDIDTLINWREQRPVWNEDGQYIESVLGSTRNKFYNRASELGSREMFVEAAAAYIEDPWTLHRRDPELFSLLKTEIFDGREFRKS